MGGGLLVVVGATVVVLAEVAFVAGAVVVEVLAGVVVAGAGLLVGVKGGALTDVEVVVLGGATDVFGTVAFPAEVDTVFFGATTPMMMSSRRTVARMYATVRALDRFFRGC